MTREDFKFKRVEDTETHFYNKAIDVAFDYFESKIEALNLIIQGKDAVIAELAKKKTCESCKWFEQEPLTRFGKCRFSEDYNPVKNFMLPDSFYCNKWSAK